MLPCLFFAVQLFIVNLRPVCDVGIDFFPLNWTVSIWTKLENLWKTWIYGTGIDCFSLKRTALIWTDIDSWCFTLLFWYGSSWYEFIWNCRLSIERFSTDYLIILASYGYLYSWTNGIFILISCLRNIIEDYDKHVKKNLLNTPSEK